MTAAPSSQTFMIFKHPSRKRVMLMYPTPAGYDVLARFDHEDGMDIFIHMVNELVENRTYLVRER